VQAPQICFPVKSLDNGEGAPQTPQALIEPLLTNVQSTHFHSLPLALLVDGFGFVHIAQLLLLSGLWKVQRAQAQPDCVSPDMSFEFERAAMSLDEVIN